ncbi:DUF1579 domain-containing protein [Flavobacterium sp.]|uniref:DUF1579 domain-containing protein n=1 Tax=Flavobacterium sp. TaxID=239 RepID=UPI002606D3DC|nr:DUF1579 domain-containing protein [Flavobacterium sp.]
MKKLFLCSSLLLLALTACKKDDKAPTDATEKSAENTAEKVEIPKDSAAVAKIWMDYGTPGEPHKRLAADVGKWNEECKFYSKPGAEPTVMKMTVDISMIHGGRYQYAKHNGSYFGMPFEGTATTGYDNASGKYFSIWTDNMGTGITYVTGTYDEASKTYNYAGEMSDPLTKSMKKIRETVELVNADKQVFTSYDTDENGKEYKAMEITMTRAK